MPRPRYLTKSRFKLALECPVKLFYTGKEDYANSKLEDSFLMALAEGGIQVGELAKQYYPGDLAMPGVIPPSLLALSRQQRSCSRIHEAIPWSFLACSRYQSHHIPGNAINDRLSCSHTLGR